jgi:hypothetical protein
MATTFLIVHGLLAVVLLGGLTHQAVAACWPARQADGFLSSFRAVSGARYTTVNIALYLVSALLGGVIYPTYRLYVRTYLEAARLWEMNGSFEVKEQFVAVGLGMLPLYWYVWREPLEERFRGARAATTAILCFIVWYGFIVGHVLNNIRGVFGR